MLLWLTNYDYMNFLRHFSMTRYKKSLRNRVEVKSLSIYVAAAQILTTSFNVTQAFDSSYIPPLQEDFRFWMDCNYYLNWTNSYS